MSAFDKYTMWESFVTPPSVTGLATVAGTKTNCRVVAASTASAAVQLSGDILVAPNPPSETASNLGELPGSGPMLVRFQATGGDVYVLFGPTNTVAVDPTNTTASKYGDRIPQDTYVDYVLNPTDHAWMAYASPTTATLKYRPSGPPSNNRP